MQYSRGDREGDMGWGGEESGNPHILVYFHNYKDRLKVEELIIDMYEEHEKRNWG